jgi:membrane-bound ClpP family serine protease
VNVLSEFLTSLTSFEKAYFYIALAGTLFFLLQSVFTFLDLGETFNFDSDFDGEMDTDMGFLGLSMPFHLFTIRGIIGFIMLFGWAGLGFSKSGTSPLYTFLIALLSGFVMMLIIALIYYSISKLKEDGNENLQTSIGKEAQVYLTIPAESQGFGKIHLVMNGSLREYEAITMEKETIKSGEVVRVVRVVNDKLVVEKSNI